ncbi:MAG: translation initiation factor IF-3 [Christensenellaceae bacterium]|nr:translation initiation factor IF-3 [Christensenellaceae bacterium]
MNGEIRAGELRVIGADNQMVGIMTLAAALRRADEDGLDLVLINEASQPPIAKITDYAKFRYEAIKKEKEQKKEQRNNIVHLKEIQLSIAIQENEIEFKMKKAREFINDGDKVKVCINRLKGRKMQLADKGVAVINAFAEKMADIAEMEMPVKKLGGGAGGVNIMTILKGKNK